MDWQSARQARQAVATVAEAFTFSSRRVACLCVYLSIKCGVTLLCRYGKLTDWRTSQAMLSIGYEFFKTSQWSDLTDWTTLIYCVILQFMVCCCDRQTASLFLSLTLRVCVCFCSKIAMVMRYHLIFSSVTHLYLFVLLLLLIEN